MSGKIWGDLENDEREEVFAEVVNMTNHLGEMSTSASSVLSNLSTLSNVLAPYIKDAIDDALDDINEATEQ